MRVAVLDDYLNVAKGLADWNSLGAEVVFFSDYINPDQCASVLAPFDVVVAMRERTAFPASLINALPALRLLVTTGARNNSIDLDACRQKGVVVSGAPGDPLSAGATAELAWALLAASRRMKPRTWMLTNHRRLTRDLRSSGAMATEPKDMVCAFI